MNKIPERVRYDVDLGGTTAIIVGELQDLLVDHKILDRAMAGGQLVSAFEHNLQTLSINTEDRVFGCELFKMDVHYAIKRYNLKGNYIYTGDYMNEPKFDGISFLPGKRDFKYIEIGNYPYNDGSINNTVIWNEFIVKARQNQADAVAVVVQASFLAQQFKGISKSVKLDLLSLGCYKIVINDYNDFDEDLAKVKTCILFCRRGYQGPVTYLERSTGFTVIQPLEKPFDMIFNPLHREFLDAVEKAHIGSFKKFPSWKKLSAADKKKYAIGAYYRTEGFDKNPLKPFKILHESDDLSKDHYVIFGTADSKQEADNLLLRLQSFWFNDAVQAILMLTRYQISLDATQYAKVPKIKIDRVFGENELFDLWQISDVAKDMAKNLVANCSHKVKSND
jgi:hypothetical protein